MKRCGGLVVSIIALGTLAARDSSWTAPRAVDLLALVDLSRDRVHGTWEKEKGTLACTRRAPAARVVLPYVPPEEYDLELVAERTGGTDAFVLGLAAGGRQFVHVLDGYTAEGKCLAGFESLDRKWARDNESRRDGQAFVNGMPATVKYAVRKGRIRAWVDGREMLDWTGEFSRLEVRSDYRVSSTETLFIGAYNSEYRFTRILLHPKSDGGKLLRGSRP